MSATDAEVAPSPGVMITTLVLSRSVRTSVYSTISVVLQ